MKTILTVMTDAFILSSCGITGCGPTGTVNYFKEGRSTFINPNNSTERIEVYRPEHTPTRVNPLKGILKYESGLRITFINTIFDVMIIERSHDHPTTYNDVSNCSLYAFWGEEDLESPGGDFFLIVIPDQQKKAVRIDILNNVRGYKDPEELLYSFNIS
ncbi:MAG: hypothetical protein LBR37_00205 [Erysipelotrichaceae bacterium]|nr:hypothetical protein [Erysipelotrichaceae bacterium]